MELKSLARRTDLIFARFEGEVIEHDSHITVRTPGNPGYHWGNYLIFAQPPVKDSLAEWQAMFRQEFAYYPVIRHMVFTWEGGKAEDAAIEPFLNGGFELDQALVLTTDQVHAAPHPRPDLHIRPLNSDDDWEQAIANQVRCRDQRFGEAGYWDFKRRQFKTYQSMMKQGLGAWFGAFAGEQLIADLGIFHDGELGRYQNVSTDPAFRRQGICGTLVSETARYAQEHWPITQLVMEADADYHAARIYESLGFKPIETNQSLSWVASESSSPASS